MVLAPASSSPCASADAIQSAALSDRRDSPFPSDDSVVNWYSVQGDDVEKLKAKIQALSTASMKIGETLSGKSSANSSSSGGADGSSTGSSEEKK